MTPSTLALALLVGSCPVDLAAEKAAHRIDRLEGQRAILVYQAKAEISEVRHQTALAKLATRTPTVTIALTVAAPKKPPEGSSPWLGAFVGGSVGIAVGVVITLFATR